MSTSKSTHGKFSTPSFIQPNAYPLISDTPNAEADKTLRQRAEQCRAAGRPPNSGPADAFEAQRLLQELEIHQIELEIQNQELQQARNEAEEAREIYRDLYDFAPVGYFTLSREGSILMANLTGATLLGLERDSLTGCAFSQWISPNNRADFDRFLGRVFNGKDPMSLELDLLQVGGNCLIVDIAARKGVADRVCRMMVKDITRRKAVEKAKRHLKNSIRSNRKLQAEVLHWREVEASMKLARDELNACLENTETPDKQLQNFSHALLQAQEAERKRLSRDLNERIAQALTAIQDELDLVLRLRGNDFPNNKSIETSLQNDE